MELELREHQVEVIEQLREGFRQGHRSQLLYAPTGFGKTEVAIYLMKATAEKYKRAAMVLDRIVLVDQTSLRLTKYRIKHGVFQADHVMFDKRHRLQVCSAQTLERRSDFPDIDLLIVDECHIARKQTSEFIKANPQVRVIGLTATPFTKGLGDLYTNVVCGATTSDLVGKKWLTPLKVYIAKEIDMTGAKKIAGEWAQDEVTERGMKITGSIVAEWEKKCNEVFGRPRKTIVFCAGVAHGADLVNQFAEKGYNFVSISYKDNDEFKKQAIEDFAKPDTEIHGLIATDILTRGFDVTDVMVGVSARPFSKSLSSHIQQMGRVMRTHEGKEFALWLDHCIASGQKVLTHRGLVAIERILISDKIWDGHEFVSHKGVVFRGKRPVITYAGLTATPDHLVKTRDEGWCSLGYCADKQKAIITTGIGRSALWECDDYFTRRYLVGTKTKKIHARSMRVRNLWLSVSYLVSKLTEWKNQGLQTMQPAETGSKLAQCTNGSNDAKMQQPEESTVRKLWWKGNQVQIRFSDFLRSLDSRELGLYFGAQGNGVRSDRQQWSLRNWEYSMGEQASKYQQSQDVKVVSTNAQIQTVTSRSSLCRHFLEITVKCGSYIRANCRKICKAITKTEREVWDILDCGPRNSFTCEGLLVHNSGNYLRFQDDWDEIYEDGVKTLDDKGEKAKKEPTEKKKKESKCPMCSALWPKNSDTCSACGHVRQKRNQVEAVAGVMEELVAGKKPKRDDKQMFYSELMYIANVHSYNPNWASHKYKEKFGVWPRGLKENPIPPSIGTRKWVKSKMIAWAKGRRA
jgi:superfamily II DNA or RNA helicase